jgi:hypothetical protein
MKDNAKKKFDKLKIILPKPSSNDSKLSKLSRADSTRDNLA